MCDRVALLRWTFGEEVKCPHCGGPLRLIALVKTEETIQALLTALHMPTGPPKGVRPPSPDTAKQEFGFSGEGECADWPEYAD